MTYTNILMPRCCRRSRARSLRSGWSRADGTCILRLPGHPEDPARGAQGARRGVPDRLAPQGGRQHPGLTWEPATTILSSVDARVQKSDVVGNGGDGDGDPRRQRRCSRRPASSGFEIVVLLRHQPPDRTHGVGAAQAEARGRRVQGQAPADHVEKQRELLTTRRPRSTSAFSGWCLDWPSGASVFPAPVAGDRAEGQLGAEPLVPRRSGDRDQDRRDRCPVDEGLAEWGKLDKWIMEKYMPVVPTTAADAHPARVQGRRRRPWTSTSACRTARRCSSSSSPDFVSRRKKATARRGRLPSPAAGPEGVEGERCSATSCGGW